MANEIALRIFNQEDRLKVAEILIKNGYTVAQRRKAKSPTGKTYEYYLSVADDTDNADTTK